MCWVQTVTSWSLLSVMCSKEWEPCAQLCKEMVWKLFDFWEITDQASLQWAVWRFFWEECQHKNLLTSFLNGVTIRTSEAYYSVGRRELIWKRRFPTGKLDWNMTEGDKRKKKKKSKKLVVSLAALLDLLKISNAFMWWKYWMNVFIFYKVVQQFAVDWQSW